MNDTLQEIKNLSKLVKLLPKFEWDFTEFTSRTLDRAFEEKLITESKSAKLWMDFYHLPDNEKRNWYNGI